MAVEIYNSAWDCIRSCEDTKTKIAAIDAIILALMESQLKRFGKAGIEEYQINDGQSIIRVKYTSLNEMTGELFLLERYRNMLINGPNCMGRVSIGRDKDSFLNNKR